MNSSDRSTPPPAADPPPAGAAPAPPSPAPEGPPTLPRREFLDRVITLSVGLTAAGCLAPLAGYVRGPDDANAAAGPVDLGRADELPPGRARAVVFGGRPVLVVRGPAGLVARSAVCTHLGCLVRWEAPRGEFLCPCHGGRFDAAGAVLGGPVHGPLAALPVREENGRILLGG